MKKITLLFATLLCGITANAQMITYSLSEEFKSVKKYTYEENFFKFDETTYTDVFCRDGKSIILQSFDKGFHKLVNETEIPLPEELKKFSIWKFIRIKNKYFLFCHNYEKKHALMLAYEFNPKTLSLMPDPVTLIDTDNIGDYSYYKFDISKDETKVLIWFVGRHAKMMASKYKENISFNTFDENMTKLYSGDIEMPYTDKDMNILDCKIDYKGDIYSLISVKENNSVDGESIPDKDAKSSRRFELMKINQKQNDLGSIKIALESKYVYDAKLIESPEKDIVITGYYSDKKPQAVGFTGVTQQGGHSANGVYLYKVIFDEFNKIKDVITSYTEFSLEMLSANESERTKEILEEKESNNALEQNNIELREVIFNTDGSMTVIGEEYYYLTSYTYYNNKQQLQYTYYYGDLLIVNIDKKGKLLWHQKIRKYQSGTNKKPLSFYRCSFHENSYFMYINNKVEFELKDKMPEGKLRGTFLTIAKLDAKGKVTKDLVYINDENVEFSPKYFETIEPGIVIKRADAGKSSSKILKLEVR